MYIAGAAQLDDLRYRPSVVVSEATSAWFCGGWYPFQEKLSIACWYSSQKFMNAWASAGCSAFFGMAMRSLSTGPLRSAGNQ